jgi:hypothetical protein
VSTIGYQIVVQWSKTRSKYEAYSPTLCDFAIKFLPGFPTTAYGDTIAEAADSYSVQACSFLEALKRMRILPPPSDTGEVDLDPAPGIEDFGKMVL